MSLVRRQWRRLALYLAVREGGTRMVSERSTAKGVWGNPKKSSIFLRGGSAVGSGGERT